ncbi:MAG: FtsX-like permease family protein [Rikenellaceae bacterium]
MIFNSTELFVARRMAMVADGSAARRTVVQRVATVAVALSLAVMIITLAVIFGFKREVHHKLTALSGSVVVATSRGVSTSPSDRLLGDEVVESLIGEAAEAVGARVENIATVAWRTAVVRGAELVDGVVLKGVDDSYDMRLFADGLVAGELPSFGVGNGSLRDVVVSQELVDDLGLELGGRLELLLSQGDDGSMRRDLYRVGAIYAAGLGGAERGVVVADIANLRRLNGWSQGEISGYEVSINDLNLAPDVARQINRKLIYSDHRAADNAAAFAVQQLTPSVFDWLAAHDVNGVVVVAIMLVVAIFNVVTALLIMVMERSRMVGTLKALGMSTGAIGRVFVIRAMSITSRGMVWGNGVGLGLCWLQWRFELLRLDESGYMLSSVPVEVNVCWWLIINTLMGVVVLVSTLLPARMVGAIEPHKAIKFQ